ncbi:MAG: cyanase [Deltaproteobacteria bacterium]|nr:cyanase [Deltaproteobacteria bacterium]
MEISEFTEVMLAAKEDAGLTFQDLAKKVGLSEVYVAALFYGQAKAAEDVAEKIASELGLDEDFQKFMVDFPDKGLGPVVPTDPLIYRFYEIMQVYGYPIKAIIHEKFGDGIMSAIDYTMDIEKVEDPKGDRVKVTMCGKFLPYKVW